MSCAHVQPVLFEVRQHELCSPTARTVQFFERLFRFSITHSVVCNRKTVISLLAEMLKYLLPF